MQEYIYQPPRGGSYEESLNFLRNKYPNRVEEGGVDGTSKEVVSKIVATSKALDLPLQTLTVYKNEYEKYFNEADYSVRYPEYYKDNIFEKTFEHYLTAHLLQVEKGETYVDIASEHSPLGEIFTRLYKSDSYSQDIMYPAGIHGKKIGGDACSMPVADGFIDKASLTCSLEHFEGDADIRLFHELNRVLRVGGKVCVAPLYLSDRELTQTDPEVSSACNVTFDDSCIIRCAKSWGNRHGRFYSPESLLRRIIDPMKDKISFEIYKVDNADTIDNSVYLRFALIGTKLSPR